MTTLEIMQKAKQVCREINAADTAVKNTALEKMADNLIKEKNAILAANKIDVDAAVGKMSESMIDRLTLTSDRIDAMAEGIRQVVGLNDPVGHIIKRIERKDGLIIDKVSVPLGVIAIIYESRPNVTSDAAALAVKSGNACILRGGKEAFNSANAIVNALQNGLEEAGLSKYLVQLIQDTSRQSANELMTGVGYVDLLIPRGGAGLINACVTNAKVPCVQTGTGICHVYVDECADLDMALSIIENAKTSRPSVCNAEEVCLVHEKVAEEFLPKLKALLTDGQKDKGKTPVQLRLDPKAAAIIDGVPAGENDFDTEFLDYILAVKVVSSAEMAIGHIAEHSTGHSDAIITRNEKTAEIFTKAVDSSAVYVNASTRFTDGGEFGLGCEMGISTQKLHARGPMGLEELNTYKYVIHGTGQIR